MKSTHSATMARGFLGRSRGHTYLDGMHSMGGAREATTSWLGALRVGELMTRPSICVDSQTSLTDARLLMEQHSIRRLPVVDDGRLVGILTLSDLRGAWPSEVTTLNRSELDNLIHQVKVERVMRREVITVVPETRLVKAARLMTDHKVGGLPVLSQDDHVIGIVTESDIFRALVALIDIDGDTQRETRSGQGQSTSPREMT